MIILPICLNSIRISPLDFILFKKKKKKLQNNSFKTSWLQSLTDERNKGRAVQTRGPEHYRAAFLCSTALIPLSQGIPESTSGKPLLSTLHWNPCFPHSSPPIAPKYAKQTCPQAELPTSPRACTQFVLFPLWRVLPSIVLPNKKAVPDWNACPSVKCSLRGINHIGLCFLCPPQCLVCASLSVHYTQLKSYQLPVPITSTGWYPSRTSPISYLSSCSRGLLRNLEYSRCSISH